MAAPYLALIVDNEPDIRELLEITLKRMDIDVHSVDTLAKGYRHLARHHYDLCLTEMLLPDGNGIDLVRHIHTRYPDTPTAVITGHGDVATAVQALKAGAADFVSKPIDMQHLSKLVKASLKVKPATHSGKRSTRSQLSLLGDAPPMQRTRQTILKLARSLAPVHIAGESGSGKELVARMIHEQGPRAGGPFIPVNCGAIPEHLMESEFFGYKKGSFTGAVSDKEGLFQVAQNGTLFLDEVADLPMHMQVKLLRAIQERAIRPVGGAKEIPINVRILSATHKNLATLVKEGRFRQDLFYRINVIELRVPSLREHPQDIPLLAGNILQRLTQENGLASVQLGPGALTALQDYTFPGNVRELENILERAITLCEGDVIRAEDLILPPQQLESTNLSSSAFELPLAEQVASVQSEAIQQALKQAQYNKTEAAKLLGMTFRQFRYRLKKLQSDDLRQ